MKHSDVSKMDKRIQLSYEPLFDEDDDMPCFFSSNVRLYIVKDDVRNCVYT